MSKKFIDYDQLINEAMHLIIKKVLDKIVKEGLQGGHYYYISFLTHYPGVHISELLKSRYPEEMTIVLQHQFEALSVHEEHFTVVLSFDTVKEKVDVPFKAVTGFADPSVRFGLQFRPDEQGEEPLDSITHQEKKEVSPDNRKDKNSGGVQGKSSSQNNKKTSPGQVDNVISIDSFRKK